MSCSSRKLNRKTLLYIVNRNSCYFWTVIYINYVLNDKMCSKDIFFRPKTDIAKKHELKVQSCKLKKHW